MLWTTWGLGGGGGCLGKITPFHMPICDAPNGIDFGRPRVCADLGYAHLGYAPNGIDFGRPRVGPTVRFLNYLHYGQQEGPRFLKKKDIFL